MAALWRLDGRAAGGVRSGRRGVQRWGAGLETGKLTRLCRQEMMVAYTGEVI